jgi:hypothetical protein
MRHILATILYSCARVLFHSAALLYRTLRAHGQSCARVAHRLDGCQCGLFENFQEFDFLSGEPGDARDGRLEKPPVLR